MNDIAAQFQHLEVFLGLEARQGKPKITERKIDRSAAFTDEWCVEVEVVPQWQHFGTGLRRAHDERDSVRSEAAQGGQARFIAVCLLVEQRPIEIRDDEKPIGV
jgi:hypothetical protein